MSRYQSEANYSGDHRVRAAEKWYKSFDEQRMILVVTLFLDDGDEEDVEFPVRFDVCPTCEGKGSHVNPSIDCNGLTAEDFHEDPDFAEEYFQGSYDVTCYGCGGRRVVPVIDEERANPELLSRLREQREADAEYRSQRANEERMGY